jgi:hypothetical protein
MRVRGPPFSIAERRGPTMWTTVTNPAWLKSETERLATRLGSTHSDVLFLSRIVDDGSIDEACLARLADFLAQAITDEAIQIGVRLSIDSMVAAGIIARVEDASAELHTVRCGRIGGPKARVQEFPDRHAALTVADAILSSPRCPSDIWLRIESAGGIVWETAEIQRALAVRAPVHAD